MVKETHVRIEQLIAPLFVSEVHAHRQEIKSMPGVYQIPLNALLNEVKTLVELNIPAVLLFGLPAHKDDEGSASLSSHGIIQQAIRLIKQHYPNLLVIADVCFCEYTSHGHCGLLKDDQIDNDKTLTSLAEQAVSFAKAGADWVAPSSMTDGMVHAIRKALDEAHFHHIAILSYAVKYSSHLDRKSVV
jgi:porphobilinogen synthase